MITLASEVGKAEWQKLIFVESYPVSHWSRFLMLLFLLSSILFLFPNLLSWIFNILKLFAKCLSMKIIPGFQVWYDLAYFNIISFIFTLSLCFHCFVSSHLISIGHNGLVHLYLPKLSQILEPLAHKQF